MLKKLLTILIIAAMMISIFAFAEEAEVSHPPVAILYTNDVHTYIDGDLTYSKLAALKDSYEDVLLVDAGDHIQGTAYGSMDEGATIIELMNAAQALEFRRPLLSSKPIEAMFAAYRKVVPFVDNDTVMFPHIASSVKFLQDNEPAC